MLPGVSINLSCLCTDNNRNSCPSTLFLVSPYEKDYLKPALLFSAFWMQKHERKHKIMLLAEGDPQIQDVPGYNPDPSFSW